ncbi:MAG: EAL domain-containing protein [Rubrobacter sp.]|nr:EAL domain-containing protein [Rubrobacter sp.]
MSLAFSFAEALGKETEARKALRGIIDLAFSLGLRVTAEGIENAKQLEELTNMSCELGQGYYFARSPPTPSRCS